MSATTIRDVVVRIRLEQRQAKLLPPDTSAFTQEINRVNQALQTAKQSAVNAHRDALNDSLSDNFGLGGGKAATPSSAGASSKAATEMLRAEQASLAISRQRTEAYTAMGESALRAARGISFLVAANEDDLKASLQVVAAAQGYVDAFSGVTGVIKGSMALRQASVATSLAQATSSGVVTAATAAETAAEAASIPVKVARVGATRAETVALAQQAAATTAAATAQGALTASMLANPLTVAVVATIGAGAAAWYSYAQSVKEAAEEEQKAGRMIEAHISNRQQNNRLETGISQMRIATSMELAGMSSDIAEKRLELDRAQDAASRIRAMAPGGIAINDRTRIEQLEQETAYNKEMINISKARMELARDLVAEKQREQTAAQAILQTARQTVQAEIEQRQSVQEKFGRLDAGQQEQLKDIARRRQKGDKLTEQEARKLDELGFGAEATSTFFREKGAAAGFDTFAAGFGLDAKIEMAQQNLKAAQASAGQALEDAFEEGTQAMTEFKSQMKTVRTFAEELRDTNAELARLKADLEKMKGQQINRDVGGKWDLGGKF